MKTLKLFLILKIFININYINLDIIKLLKWVANIKKKRKKNCIIDKKIFVIFKKILILILYSIYL